MIVLGITDGISCGAAIAVDGRVVSAVNEEALSRLKMAYGFPRRSIAEALRIAGLEAKDVGAVAVATKRNHFFNGVRPWKGWFSKRDSRIRESFFGAAGRLGVLSRLPGVEQLYYGARQPIFAHRRNSIRRILRSEFDLRAPVSFIDHHLAHCAGAYFTSGFNDALVVSMDGGGDGLSSRIYSVRDGRFRACDATAAFHSLGNYYSYVTELCGFSAQRHEGKITGLAAHGEPRYVDLLDGLITVRKGRLLNVGRAVFSGALRKLGSKLPPGWTREDLAASIQLHCERLAVACIRLHLRSGEERDVALAGGLFANVRINQEIARIPSVNRLFVHPGMSDAGLAVGAALALGIADDDANVSSFPSATLDNVYWGPGFSDSAVQSALSEAGLVGMRPPDLEREVAARLAEGFVVARFSGRMEYGPRALGNRSVLYQPSDPAVNDWLNTKLRRTEFMPFAPVTLMEAADNYYEDLDLVRDSARFMTVTCDCTERMKASCSGAVHIDGTARPQLIRRDDNPEYHRIVEEFAKITDCPTLINTSFNMHEEPIVCTPEDAIRAFLLGELDYLAIGGLLVKSPKPIHRQLQPAYAASSVAK